MLFSTPDQKLYRAVIQKNFGKVLHILVRTTEMGRDKALLQALDQDATLKNFQLAAIILSYGISGDVYERAITIARRRRWPKEIQHLLETRNQNQFTAQGLVGDFKRGAALVKLDFDAPDIRNRVHALVGEGTDEASRDAALKMAVSRGLFDTTDLLLRMGVSSTARSEALMNAVKKFPCDLMVPLSFFEGEIESHALATALEIARQRDFPRTVRAIEAACLRPAPQRNCRIMAHGL